MRTCAASLSVLLAVSLASCNKDKDTSKEAKPEATKPNAETTKPNPTKPDPKPTKPTPEPPKTETAELSNKAKNCPSAVAGAATSFAEKDGTLVATITGKNEPAAVEIRKRAAHLVKIQGTDAKGGHTGTGSSGGSRGACPVVLADTSLAIAGDVDGGVTLTITPKDSSKLAELKGAAEHRLATLNRRGKGFHTGRGHGSGTGGGSSKGAGGGEGPDKTPAKTPPKKKRPEIKGGW